MARDSRGAGTATLKATTSWDFADKNVAMPSPACAVRQDAAFAPRLNGVSSVHGPAAAAWGAVALEHPIADLRREPFFIVSGWGRVSTNWPFSPVSHPLQSLKSYYAGTRPGLARRPFAGESVATSRSAGIRRSQIVPLAAIRGARFSRAAVNAEPVRGRSFFVPKSAIQTRDIAVQRDRRCRPPP